MKPFVIAHSPDPDDAYLFYGFARGLVGIEGYEIAHHLEGIEELNRRAEAGEFPLTAVSAAAYPRIADKYRILSCGSSMGRGYGPIVAGKKGSDPLVQLKGSDPFFPELNLLGSVPNLLSVPGERTTAHLLARIFLPPFTPVFVPFDRVFETVEEGHADAALVIHEGQLTYADRGFEKIADLGELWQRESGGLPLPLGLDVIRRDLGDHLHRLVCERLRESIRLARENPDDSLTYAMGFGRGIAPDVCRTFVGMYVNEDTFDMGEEGKAALARLYALAFARGLIAAIPPLDIVP